DPAKVTGVVQKKGTVETLELARRGDDWAMVKPAEQKADEKTVTALLRSLTGKANRVAAYPATDLKPFGLDQPVAVVTLKLPGADGKMSEQMIRVGKPAEEKTPEGVPPDRYALANDTKTVLVLTGPLADRLLAGPLGFRDRLLAKFVDTDKVNVTRGTGQLTISKVDGTWKVTAPVEAEAEHTELENLVNGVSRLQASEFVAEKPTPDQLKAYGLDKPELRWQFI